MEEIKPGLYRHFKGALIEVLYIAKHSESLESLVIYKHINDNNVWARPASMWNEIVTDSDGNKVPRFKFEEKSESKYNIPNMCGECKYIGIYDTGPYVRNKHCCCELLYQLTDEEYKVKKDSLFEMCPLKNKNLINGINEIKNTKEW